MAEAFRPDTDNNRLPDSLVGGETCMICGRRQSEGLHIAEEFICIECEREMVRTEVWDAKYPFFIHRMKQMWQQKNA